MKPKKRISPYFFAFATLFSLNTIKTINTDAETTTPINWQNLYSTKTHLESEYQINMRKKIVQERADNLINTYIDNVLAGINRILENKKTKGYRRAVQSELPGAPCSANHTWHCLYGQYTQLNRALSEQNDCIKIIPTTDNAHQATSSFTRHMTKLYDTPEYNNAIHHGNIYQTDKEYNVALDKYLQNAVRGKHGDLDSLRAKYTKDFAQKNYSASELKPGSIIIVGSGHAVMYLGQGNIVNKTFVPDTNGRAVCCAYNTEQPAVYLSIWNTHNTFAADINKIAAVQYYKEMENTEPLSYNKLVTHNNANVPETNVLNQTTPTLNNFIRVNNQANLLQKFNSFTNNIQQIPTILTNQHTL